MIDTKKYPPIITNPSPERATGPIAETREKLRGKGRLIGALALTTAVAVNSYIGNRGAEDPGTPLDTTVTTTVQAEEGDTLLGLQQQEGMNGMPTDEARQKLTELNGGSNEVIPGQNVVLLDNVDNNPPVEEQK